MRGAIVVGCGLAALGACTLTTNLSGLTGGSEDAGAADTGATDAGIDGPDADGGDASCDEDGLVAFWRFDEGAGRIVHDCTTNHNDGLVTTGGWAQGVHGTAVSLDGGWVGFGVPPSLVLTGDLTAAAFVRVAALSPAPGGYFVGKTQGQGANGWGIYIDDTGFPVFAVTANGAAGILKASSPVAQHSWVHIAAVHQGGSIRIYVDGLDVGDLNAPASVTDSPAEMRLGAKGDGSRLFIGDLDDVRVYGRALTAAEVYAIAQR
jgi:hypothetical protein